MRVRKTEKQKIRGKKENQYNESFLSWHVAKKNKTGSKCKSLEDVRYQGPPFLHHLTYA
jgi:hypothetical protein